MFLVRFFCHNMILSRDTKKKNLGTYKIKLITERKKINNFLYHRNPKIRVIRQTSGVLRG